MYQKAPDDDISIFCSDQHVSESDGECSFITYLYADRLIQWTTGDASGDSGGLGGTPTQAGFDAGDRTRSFSHPDSQTAQCHHQHRHHHKYRYAWSVTFRVDLEGDCSAECV